MGRRVMMMLIVVIVAMDLITERSEATTHIVGDSMGWTIPQSGATAYTDWAATQTFAVGDILVFNYTTGIHDVAKVTKANYDACNSTSPISLSTTGPTNITLTTAGSHYFFCTFGSHCSLGQKLAVNVPTASTTPSPSPSPSSPTPSSPSPAPSTATSPSPAPSTATSPSPGTSPVPASAPAPATATPTSSISPSPSPSPTSPSPTSPAPTSPTPSPAGGTTGSPPSPPPPPPPPPPPSSFAPSVAAAATGVTFLAIALALVY